MASRFKIEYSVNSCEDLLKDVKKDVSAITDSDMLQYHKAHRKKMVCLSVSLIAAFIFTVCAFIAAFVFTIKWLFITGLLLSFLTIVLLSVVSVTDERHRMVWHAYRVVSSGGSSFPCTTIYS